MAYKRYRGIVIPVFQPGEQTLIVEGVQLAKLLAALGRNCVRQGPLKCSDGACSITAEDFALEGADSLQGFAQRCQLAFTPGVKGALTVAKRLIGPTGFGMAYQKQVLHWPTFVVVL
jgi:hypothetical protein